jgi:hypothetical protein
MTNVELADCTLTAVAAASHLAALLPPCCNRSRPRCVATGCNGCVANRHGFATCHAMLRPAVLPCTRCPSCLAPGARAALHQVPVLPCTRCPSCSRASKRLPPHTRRYWWPRQRRTRHRRPRRSARRHHLCAIVARYPCPCVLHLPCKADSVPPAMARPLEPHPPRSRTHARTCQLSSMQRSPARTQGAPG